MGKKKAYMKSAHLFSGENNQFRMKFNRSKHQVLNASSKGTQGNRTMSKGIAYTKRKERWEKSQTISKKANRFIDKRLLDPSMSFEDQTTARFIKERQKMGKKNKFNLNDDEEELTHKGKPLLDINDLNSDAGGSEDDETGLDSNFVSKAHFGGFTSESNFESPKSHKEIMEQLISDSKLKKQEQKLEKERYIQSQEEIDKQWREIHSLDVLLPKTTSGFNKNVAEPTSVKETKDIYDISKNELKFESRGVSITHTKSPEELIKLEEEKKIQREKERLARMVDSKESDAIHNHKSADALCDEYDFLQPVSLEESDTENLVKDSDTEKDDDVAMSDEDEEDNQSSDDQLEISSDIPQDMKSFKQQVDMCTVDNLFTTVDNILKTTIRSKKEKVKSKLVNFFQILLEYCLDCTAGDSSDVEKAGVLLPHLHSLAEVDPSGTAQKFLECMDKEQLIFQESKKHWKQTKMNYPRMQAMAILKFVELIYSVSDRVHPVALPAMDFMSDILTSKCINTHSNIVSRLLISKIWLNYIKDSKRFVPEIINFLDYVLKLAITDKNLEGKSKKKKFNLILNDNLACKDISPLSIMPPKKLFTAGNKVSIIFETMSCLNELVHMYENLLSFKAFFYPSVNICSQLPLKYFPIKVQESITNFMESVQNKKLILHQLTFPNLKPKGLKMFEPAFESKFNTKDDINKKRKLIKQVSQKIRKEERGMIREIRQETRMVAAEKLKKIIESDNERKRKVKEIYAELATQEGEYKKMMKKKR